MRFKNGSNKVVIKLRVVQFWSEIILVISNRTRAARSFDFEITRMISDQIALHSVQLPLWMFGDFSAQTPPRPLIKTERAMHKRISKQWKRFHVSFIAGGF